MEMSALLSGWVPTSAAHLERVSESGFRSLHVCPRELEGKSPSFFGGLLRPWRSSTGDNQTAEIKGKDERRNKERRRERRRGGEGRREKGWKFERERRRRGIRERKISKSEIPEDSPEFLFLFFFHVCNKAVISILDHTKPILYRETRVIYTTVDISVLKVRWDLIWYRIKHISYWFFLTLQKELGG